MYRIAMHSDTAGQTMNLINQAGYEQIYSWFIGGFMQEMYCSIHENPVS